MPSCGGGGKFVWLLSLTRMVSLSSALAATRTASAIIGQIGRDKNGVPRRRLRLSKGRGGRADPAAVVVARPGRPSSKQTKQAKKKESKEIWVLQRDELRLR